MSIIDGLELDELRENSAILKEIEKRLAEWFAVPGWSEEGSGLRMVETWIEELRSHR